MCSTSRAQKRLMPSSFATPNTKPPPGAARALFVMSIPAPKSEVADLWMDVTLVATDTIAESLYWSSLFMGARARAKNLEGLDLLPTMVEATQRALQIDPTIMHGGPDSALGGIYLRAPA